MNTVIAQLKHIHKQYQQTIALQDVSMQIPAGQIVGFIGADGAGKSTLMKILLTLERADSGEITVFGKEIHSAKKEIRTRVGYMPEVFSLYQDLSVEENLKFFFQIYRIPKHLYHEKLSWLYQFNRLQHFKSTLAAQLSGGMKQKLALSCALMNDPELLCLDEPTTGVDPVSRMEFWQMLHQLKDAGKTILISTPYLDEAVQCDTIFLFHQGSVLLDGAPEKVINSYPAIFYELESPQPLQDIKKFREKYPDLRFYLIGDRIHIAVRQDNQMVLANFKKTEQLNNLFKIQPTLEDVFLDLLEKKSNDQLASEKRDER
ncbi:MAG: hypothetical protein Kow00108_21500 [Calditrichia bacterium]